MKLKVMSIVLCGAALLAGAAHADMSKGKFSGEAELAAPHAKTGDVVIKGITWRCEGTRCTATANDWPGLDSFIKQCRIVSSELGELSSFKVRGRAADKSELSACNRSARA